MRTENEARVMGMISQKLRNSARGQPCHFQIPGVCNGDPETTVLCHIRDERKGLGNKASDWSSAFGCSACHDTIDQHKLPPEDETFYSFRAMQRTWDYWITAGLIFVAGIDPDKPKTRPKKPSNLPKGRKIQGRSSFERGAPWPASKGRDHD
jgi:hypothetical protein